MLRMHYYVIYFGLALLMLTTVAMLFAKGSKTVFLDSEKTSSIRPRRRVSSLERKVAGVWALATIGAATMEVLQVFAAISAFFFFVYLMWIGVIRPTL